MEGERTRFEDEGKGKGGASGVVMENGGDGVVPGIFLLLFLLLLLPEARAMNSCGSQQINDSGRKSRSRRKRKIGSTIPSLPAKKEGTPCGVPSG
jgi:hypothetical protein